MDDQLSIFGGDDEPPQDRLQVTDVREYQTRLRATDPSLSDIPLHIRIAEDLRDVETPGRPTQITELAGETWDDAFGGRAHARNGDPATSHAAAASLSDDRLRETQKAVLDCFQLYGPAHHELLVQRYGDTRGVHGWPMQSVSGLRTRTSELRVLGLIVDSGDRVKLVSGRQSIVWRLA